jgi:Fe-S-cluster-containing dehydrogenase component
MKKWNLIVDVALCENCRNCALAAKDEHAGNDYPGYAAPQPARGHDWIRITRKTRGTAHMADAAYLPTMCNHCDDAPCVKAGRGAVRKRDDGIVIIDPVRSRGRRDLVDACPYGAIVWNEELELPQAWIFDAHLLDAGWKEPRCAQACPTGALRAVRQDDEAMRAQARAESLEVTHPRFGTASAVCTLGDSVYLGTLRLYVTAPAASTDEQVAPRASAAKAA